MAAYDLAIRIEGQTGLAAQLYRELRRAILEGRLRSGERLPSSRNLALMLGLSRNTILKAEERLISGGFLVAQRGSGTFVAAAVIPKGPSRTRAVHGRRLSPWAEGLPNIPVMAETLAASIDFRPGIPDLKGFPAEAWQRASGRMLRMFRRELGLYADPAGHGALREELALHLRTSRGIEASPANIIITNGAQQAFDILGRTLIRPGLCVALEDPGYPAAAMAMCAAGAALAPVPVDAEGLIVDRLPNEAKLIYVTPSHQCPLGYTMSLPRRLALLDWAQRHGALVIEDDYDSEYRYGGRPVEALQGLGGASCVAYVGSFSKTLLPSLRLGYLVAPADFLGALLAAKWVSDRHVPSLTQMALAEFMSDGSFARFLHRMRRIYAERHALLSEGLLRIAPDLLRPIPSFSGLHLTTLLTEGIEESEMRERALAADVGVYPLSPLGIAARPKGLLFGFGNLPLALIRNGLARLTATFADHSVVRTIRRTG
jgi:GntR family transcriptional regulator / MocR family aminotransferase